MAKKTIKDTDKRHENKGGREPMVIDWDFVDNGLRAWANGTTIAAKLGISAETLYLRVEEKFNIGFSAYQQLKRMEGNDNVAKSIYNRAVEGSTTDAIWWDKTRNGMKETTDHNINTNAPQMTTEQMIAILKGSE